MPEDLNQKISQFIDNELSHDDAKRLLQAIRRQPELEKRLIRFEAVSHALKTGVYAPNQTGFSEAVRQAIHKEPTYLLPQHKPRARPSYQQWAVAASLVVAVGLVVLGVKQSASKSPISSPQQLAAKPQVEPASKPVVLANQNELRPLNARINEYLQAHKSSVYAEDFQYHPLARVTAYSQK